MVAPNTLIWYDKDMEQITLRLNGQVPSQKNSKQIAYNQRTHRPFIMTSPRVKAWQKDAMLQLATVPPIKGAVAIHIVFTHKDKRKRDIDNEQTSIMDILKNMSIIEDDNCFIVRKAVSEFAGVDPKNAGADITITKLS